MQKMMMTWIGLIRSIAVCRAPLVCLVVGVLVAGPAAAQATTRILVFGDSLSAAHGMARAQGWVALLQKRLAARAYHARVINASISGQTTAGGLARLPAALKRVHPDIVILELGGNDGLRALPVAAMKNNLARMIRAARAAGARVLLLGMRIPSNYGKRYTKRFHAAFNALAKQTGVAYVPFFLAPIATDRGRFQADGIHPDAKAQPVLLGQVWPALHRLLTQRQRGNHRGARSPMSKNITHSPPPIAAAPYPAGPRAVAAKTG